MRKTCVLAAISIIGALSIGAVAPLPTAGASPHVAAVDDETTVPSVIPGNAPVVEGDVGTTVLELPVTLSMPALQVVTVEWTTVFSSGWTSVAAKPGEDYLAASGSITFAPGETAKSVAITVNGDVTPEIDELVAVSFHDATNATVRGLYGLGLGQIKSDDIVPTIVPGGASVVEGGSGTTTVEVPVTLSAPSVQTVTVEWSTVYTFEWGPTAAKPDDDYVSAGGTLTFAPGETEKTVAITVKGDLTGERDELVVLAFRDASNATVGGLYGLGFGQILDDDSPPTIVIRNVTVAEGNSGTHVALLPVVLTRATDHTVTADWETVYSDNFPPIAARPGEDYSAARGTVTFAPGETTAWAAITINGDRIVEIDEQIPVVFTNPVGAPFVTTTPFGLVNIINDDTAPT